MIREPSLRMPGRGTVNLPLQLPALPAMTISPRVKPAAFQARVQLAVGPIEAVLVLSTTPLPSSSCPGSRRSSRASKCQATWPLVTTVCCDTGEVQLIE